MYDRRLDIEHFKFIDINEKTVSQEQFNLANCCLGISFERNLVDASLKP